MGLLGKGGLGGLLGGIQRQTQGGLLDPDRLARAMAFAYGDYGEAAQIGESMAQRGLKEQQQKAAQDELMRRAQILMQRGVPEEEAYALAGDDTAFRQIVAPQQNEPPGIARELEFFEGIQGDPNKVDALRKLYDIKSPWRVMGADQRPYQIEPPQRDAPDFIPDEQWGGGAGNGPGRFR